MWENSNHDNEVVKMFYCQFLGVKSFKMFYAYSLGTLFDASNDIAIRKVGQLHLQVQKVSHLGAKPPTV